MKQPTRGFNKHGFVLLTVITVVTACLAIGTIAISSTRLSLRETQNRIAYQRALWLAEECAERARAALHEASTDNPSHVRSWSRFDQIAHDSPLLATLRSCSVSLLACGDRLDIRDADGELLHRSFAALGVDAVRADSLVDALLDWQDADTVSRPLGAESSWYQNRSRVVPRNAPIAHIDELRLIRGFDSADGVAALFDVEKGRLSLTHTPREVLAIVPGIGPEIADAIEMRRQRGGLVREIPEVFGEVSAASRTSYLNYQESLVAQITVEPDCWLLTSAARVTGSQVTAVLELKLARSGSSASVVRRRARWA